MRQQTRPEWAVRRAAQIVVFACAATAGVHIGLVPGHLRDEPRLGAAFIAAVALLLASAFVLTFRPTDPHMARAVAILLGGLIAVFTASRTAGIPLLAPVPEPVETVGLFTNAVEALGLVFALWLGQPLVRHRRRPVHQEVSQ